MLCYVMLCYVNADSPLVVHRSRLSTAVHSYFSLSTVFPDKSLHFIGVNHGGWRAVSRDLPDFGVGDSWWSWVCMKYYYIL